MGWSSGTELFDVVAKEILDLTKHLSVRKPTVEVFKKIILAFEEHDWDVQNESKYYSHPIVKQAFIELHPDWDWE